MATRGTAAWAGITMLVTLLALASPVLPAQPATGARVAYVDMLRVIEESRLFSEGRQRLSEEFRVRTQVLELEEARLRELEGRRDGAVDTLAAAELARLREEIDTLDRSVQRRRSEMNRALNRRMNELQAEIDRKVREEIAAHARAEGLDLVFTEGVGFAHPRLDITDRILERLDAGGGDR
jgi:outer membrane protein